MTEIIRLFDNEEEYNSPTLDKISHIVYDCMKDVLSQIEDVEKEEGIRIHRRDLHYVLSGEIDNICVSDIIKRQREKQRNNNDTRTNQATHSQRS